MILLANRSSPYLHFIKTTLDNLGCSRFFYDTLPQNLTISQAILIVKQTTKDQFVQQWTADINSTNIALFYKSIKDNFHFEPYLDILPTKLRTKLTKFRLSNHRLPIETGRWNHIPWEERVCPSCPNMLADEFHFLYECSLFDAGRQNYLHPSYYKHPNMYKTNRLFSSKNKNTLLKLSKFVDMICQHHR